MAFLEYRPTETLYQFCSVDSFFGILTSKRLWCTDLTVANDPREIELGYQHFLEALQYVRQNEYTGTVGEFLVTLTGMVKRYRDNQQTFCTCFSPLKDNLPMWREYGNSHSGLAIGFRPTAITSMPGRIQKVKYLSSDTADDYRQLIRDIASNFDPHRRSEDYAYWIEAGTSVFSSMTALKHHSWDYEREVRFIHAQVRERPKLEMPIAEYSDGVPIFWEKPLSRQRGESTVEYKALPFGRRKGHVSDPFGAIERVIVGPRCELTILDVRRELEKNGFKNFVVEASECQLR